MDNQEQTIFIAGATGSIGGGAAVALARRGSNVVLLGRNREKLEMRANMIRERLSHENTIANISILPVDFTDLTSVKRAADEALAKYKKINTVILSVGRLVQNGPHILPNGHELMFATSIIGPFILIQLLLKRLTDSNGLVLQVIAPFYKEIDWADIQSIRKHDTTIAYNRVKTAERLMIGEMSRKYEGKITSIAFNPSFIIDKSDPELNDRWPKGFLGAFWRIFSMIASKPPLVAGEPIADIVLNRDREKYNGAYFLLNKRISKKDKAMSDKVNGSRLWTELIGMTCIENR